MYDFDMMESFYDDFDFEEFAEACDEYDFDDLFIENEDGSYDYVGDIYTEAFGKKKKSGFSMPSFGGKKKKSGFSLGGNNKKKKKSSGKLPPAAKVTAEVAGLLALAAGIITVIKAIIYKVKKYKLDEVGNYKKTLEEVKKRMKDTKEVHKNYVKSLKGLEKEERKEQKKFVSKTDKRDYKDVRKADRKDLRAAQLAVFATRSLAKIRDFGRWIKSLASKVANKAKGLNIPIPWKKGNSKAAQAAEGEATQESAFIEAVVNSFVQESAELLEDDTNYLYDDVYESVLSDLYDESYDYDDYEESYEDDFDDLF